MANLTKDQKRIKELEQQLKASGDALEAERSEKNTISNLFELNKRVIERKDSVIQNLQSQINVINEEFEKKDDPSTQTITHCTGLLLKQYSSISCRVTRKEVLKQFNAAIILGMNEDQEKLVSGIQERIKEENYINNVKNDVLNFLGNLIEDKVVSGNR